LLFQGKAEVSRVFAILIGEPGRKDVRSELRSSRERFPFHLVAGGLLGQIQVRFKDRGMPHSRVLISAHASKIFEFCTLSNEVNIFRDDTVKEH
jgi:hypothetical protein